MMTSRKRKARLPGSEAKEIVFTQDDWKNIEQAYGHDLPLEAREYIRFVTNAASVVGNVERTAPALEEIKAKTKTLSDAAESLLKEAGWPSTEIDTSFETLTDELAKAVKEHENDHYQFLLMVYAMLAGCNLMLSAWETDSGLREGWIWDAWVQGISEMLEHHGRRSAARKDSRKRRSHEVSSSFVMLIDALQKKLPEELQRHKILKTTDALEQAINRARKSNRWPMLLPPSIRAKYASFLESPQERAERYEKFKQVLKAAPGWVKRRPGSFVNKDSPYQKIIRKRREQKVEPDSPDTDDAAP
jgi:hypothetical protein